MALNANKMAHILATLTKQLRKHHIQWAYPEVVPAELEDYTVGASRRGWHLKPKN